MAGGSGHGGLLFSKRPTRDGKGRRLLKPTKTQVEANDIPIEGEHLSPRDKSRFCCVLEFEWPLAAGTSVSQTNDGGIRFAAAFSGKAVWSPEGKECDCACCDFVQAVKAKIVIDTPDGKGVVDTRDKYVEDCEHEIKTDKGWERMSAVHAYSMFGRVPRMGFAKGQWKPGTKECFGKRRPGSSGSAKRRSVESQGGCRYDMLDVTNAELPNPGKLAYDATFMGRIVDLCQGENFATNLYRIEYNVELTGEPPTAGNVGRPNANRVDKTGKPIPSDNPEVSSPKFARLAHMIVHAEKYQGSAREAGMKSDARKFNNLVQRNPANYK